jgi:hypothetical protein
MVDDVADLVHFRKVRKNNGGSTPRLSGVRPSGDGSHKRRLAGSRGNPPDDVALFDVDYILVELKLALAVTDTLTLALAWAAADTPLPAQDNPATPMSPIAWKVAAVLLASSAAGPLSSVIMANASPHALMCASKACCSFTSPTTTTVACGFEQSIVACASALHEPRHSALAMQLREPVHRGGLALAEQEPWHSPSHVAVPGM